MATHVQEDAPDDATSVELLQIRLRRLEFLLSGSSDLDGIPETTMRPQEGTATVLARLAILREGLAKVRRGDGHVGEMVNSVETIFNRYPELRKHTSSVNLQDQSTQASVVLAHATLYPETASRLASLQNLQIPSAESSSQLTSLRKDIENCRQEQQQIDNEVQDLRQRSAQCLEWWVKTGVVGMGDMWEEWEYRMNELERQVARFDRLQKDREGYI